MVFLSIVIPAYNEEARIGHTLEGTLAFLQQQEYDAEILVVNDGSKDRTAECVLAYEPQAGGRLRLLHNPGNRGKGFSVRHGMLQAKGRIVLFYDADLATPTSEIPKVVTPIANDAYDVVFGSRALDRSLIATRQSGFRENIGRIFNWIQWSLTGLKFSDTQCGFKAFRREAAQAIFNVQRIDGFGFDPEALFIAQKQGWRLLEMPVRWHHVDGSKINPYTASFSMFAEVATIRWNDLMGRYGVKAQLANLKAPNETHTDA